MHMDRHGFSLALCLFVLSCIAYSVSDSGNNPAIGCYWHYAVTVQQLSVGTVQLSAKDLADVEMELEFLA